VNAQLANHRHENVLARNGDDEFLQALEMSSVNQFTTCCIVRRPIPLLQTPQRAVSVTEGCYMLLSVDVELIRTSQSDKMMTKADRRGGI
jgi:hypothetical protein